MPHSTICLAFSDTGGGHRSASDAIESALRELLAEVNPNKDISIFSDNIIEKTHPVNRAFVDIYNFLLRHSQVSMRYYYWFLHVAKPNSSDFGYSLTGPYLRKMLSEVQPELLVCVHPMLNHYLFRAKQDLGLKDTKLITVITDPNDQLWRGWGCEGTDLIIAPNQIVHDKLLEWGIKPERIKVIGMPVNPDFLRPTLIDPSEFKRNLGLMPDRFTLCVNAGWAGGGNMLSIYRALDAVKRPIQVIFLCGHNKNLYQRILIESEKSSIPTAVLPFHDRMADLMPAVDMMVTKAGGLTTYEAVARRLFTAFDNITEPMPQEARTIDILVDNGLAKRINRPSDIVDIIQSAPSQRLDYLNGKLPKAQNLDRTDAVFDIAKIVLEQLCPPLTVKPRVLTRPAEPE
jgi:UDP-N-acetylglucosamine:LPS N-acetylglucosamine transferase